MEPPSDLDIDLDTGSVWANVRFVDHILANATSLNATRIRFARKSSGGFERNPGNHSSGDYFVIEMEIDGKYQEVAQPPLIFWDKVVRRLKILAELVEYGPHKSVSGAFQIRYTGGRDEMFVLTSNPNPYFDRELVLVRDSTGDTGDEAGLNSP